MIEIKIPEDRIGWLWLTIENKSFEVSYLNDFINDMKNLLTSDDDNHNDTEVHRVYFDGEGEDLYLTAWKELDTLYIVWEHYGKEDKSDLKIMQFNYNDFVKEFNDKLEAAKDVYYKKFDFDSMFKNNK